MARRFRDNQTAPLWIEQGEAKSAPLISVAPAAPIDKVYTFTASDELAAQIDVGQRVLVPFGRKGTLAPAFVVCVETGPWSSTLKPVAEILDQAGQLNEHLLELGKWISRYYCCPLGRALASMVPHAVRRQSGFRPVRRVSLKASEDELSAVRLGAKQKRVVECLKEAGEAMEASALLEAAGAARATLRSLIAKGWIVEAVTKEAPRPAEARAAGEPGYELNPDQQAALTRVSAAIEEDEFRALVFYGVSGSGKTEVYIHVMRRVLAAGKQAIMLVPEIALTTQLTQRLTGRFERVAMIHSGLSDVERSLAWEEIRTGRTAVVIGTRSAVFAPCPNPGIIVVDEEQESSYKNLQAPRFNVRDVAIKRAALLDIPVLLGSATPSLETWHNQQKLSAYERIELPHRVRGLPLPRVRLVNTRAHPGPRGGGTLSRVLHDELAATLQRKEQTVLLLNRRGYSTWLYCPSCKRMVECPHCRANMILHLSRGRLLCHHCHSATEVPTHCADLSCGARLVRGGGGTERIEEHLREAFPAARIHRADSDTMTHPRKYRALVRGFEAGDIDILVGTQMIAKGLDFPNVSLVGVIGADLFSALSDFRASERLFQLVTQVAGRAGRADVSGRVVVQSAAPDLPALRFAIDHDFKGFAAAELRKRRALGLPPFVRVARFVLAAKGEKQAATEAGALAGRIRETIEQVSVTGASVLGPHPCALERLRGMYRYELLLRTTTAGDMLTILDRARYGGAFKAKVKSFVIDVDPVSLT